MTHLRLAIDNDIVVKLAQMDAYIDGLSAIGVGPSEVASTTQMLTYLATAPHTGKIKLTPAEQSRLHQAVKTIADIGMTTAESLVAVAMMKAILLAGLDLQEGEAALMAIAIERPALEVATGDKRALRDLPKLAAIYPRLAGLKGRVICLEQIFRNLCGQKTIKRVRAAVVQAPHADATITGFYDETASKGDPAFIAGMNFVIQKQITETAPGWLKAL
jgi:hypothetical protein